MYLNRRILLDITKGLILWNFDIFKKYSCQVQFSLSSIQGVILIPKTLTNIHLHKL